MSNINLLVFKTLIEDFGAEGLEMYNSKLFSELMGQVSNTKEGDPVVKQTSNDESSFAAEKILPNLLNKSNPNPIDGSNDSVLKFNPSYDPAKYDDLARKMNDDLVVKFSN